MQLRQLATFHDELYAVGYLSLDGGPEILQVARCDGHTWQSIGSLSPGGEIHALEVHGDILFAGGLFESIGGVPLGNIAGWDGSGWRPVGGGVEGRVTALASYGQVLMVGGLVYSVGGRPTHGLARWDGASWSAVPEIIAIPIASMGVVGGRLFIVGDTVILPTAPGLFAGENLNRIAQFDGAGWSGVGSGLNNRARAMVDYRGSLYAAGEFTEAGSKASFHVARWDLVPRGIVPNIEWLPSTPNPFSNGTTLSFVLATPGRAKLTIHDLSGREVARPVEGALAAGLRSVSWNGADAHGRRLPAGVYFARLALEGARTRSTRLVLVK